MAADQLIRRSLFSLRSTACNYERASRPMYLPERAHLAHQAPHIVLSAVLVRVGQETGGDSTIGRDRSALRRRELPREPLIGQEKIAWESELGQESRRARQSELPHSDHPLT